MGSGMGQVWGQVWGRVWGRVFSLAFHFDDNTKCLQGLKAFLSSFTQLCLAFFIALNSVLHSLLHSTLSYTRYPTQLFLPSLPIPTPTLSITGSLVRTYFGGYLIINFTSLSPVLAIAWPSLALSNVHKGGLKQHHFIFSHNSVKYSLSHT